MSDTVQARVRQAVAALKQGELIILTDDQNREHEGDLVGLASFVTPEKINQALTIARGVLAVPMTAERAAALGLAQMTQQNSEKFGTKFTVSVDHIDSTTGVSAFERAHTIQQLANLSAGAQQFETPGHIFPLVAEDGGVLQRQGHTEGAVELAKIAGVPPVAYIIEILSDDGHMAREASLAKLAATHGLQQLSMADLVAYREFEATLSIQEGVTVHLPTRYGDLMLTEYQTGQAEPALLLRSQQSVSEPPLVRLHSECLTGDTFGSYRCDCGPQLQAGLAMVAQDGGAVLYLRQEGRGIGLHEKLRSYVLQEHQFDTYDANLHLNHQPDERTYSQAAEILRAAGLTTIRLITNNPDKVTALKACGIDVVARVPLLVGKNPYNETYLQTKKEKFQHQL
ncbi:bifunctional 3,4-dihydroxy-2-butanone 4-phosphate synthase/GTP cyclohydrolase II [Leuconostoc garlicum]|uniref:Bifunctional 3,4-dihydroxy-2-butanone 4-phosphate synthase/GTP cyclohydrolase II n=1 Tax=Leuconostoc garlicum TaxID=255248 RepID=A0ABM6HUC9_9LACO|nr:bifunctional 3,4-dihydroxy-2-butanone-4-phosphate synthase/GTP cyclohydrolase II [Leuconostoc garlicum]AQN79994.1 bifunctional 3,4-dihydroxy-2-butanone 4-phosphate synthase/GTP cyclohydrolase II [Leuconostoc garlicum]